MSLVLAESKNFRVTSEYEKVSLNFKNCKRDIYIGDFYGDPQAAAISCDESFCVMVGCGLIIYYMHEPFEDFRYNASTRQWKELFRENERTWWINEAEILDKLTIAFTVEEADKENGGRYKLNTVTLELTKCN
ncbi:MAG TPA: hypothetical protein DDW50_14860 [Firmicutes bacterium]|jgi:hypothetical protein|nr:hypothetical protein [Bacillota bacterium]